MPVRCSTQQQCHSCGQAGVDCSQQPAKITPLASSHTHNTDALKLHHTLIMVKARQPNATSSHHASPFEYEFCGPFVGPVALIIGLPAICYLLFYACNASGCASWTSIIGVPGFANTPLITWSGLLTYCGWFLFVALLHLTLPGTWATGTQLPNGGVLEYKLNGTSATLHIAVSHLNRHPVPHHHPRRRGHQRRHQGRHHPLVGLRPLCTPPHWRRLLFFHAFDRPLRCLLCTQPPARPQRHQWLARVRFLHGAGAQPKNPEL